MNYFLHYALDLPYLQIHTIPYIHPMTVAIIPPMDTSQRNANITPIVVAIVDTIALMNNIAFTDLTSINAVAGGPIIQPVTKIAPTV